MPRRQTRRAPPGAGTLYWSDKQQRYIGAVTLGTDAKGKRIRKVIVGPRGGKSDDDRLGVQDRLTRFVREKRPGKKRITTRATLRQYLDDWLDSKTKLSEAATANYRWAIDHYIVPALGNVKLLDLDRKTIRRFLSTLKLSTGSKDKIRTVLRAALQDAVIEHDYLVSNPAAGVELPDRLQHSEIATWNAGEAKRFLRVAKNTEQFPLFLLAIVGALGPAELFGLRWKDVDLSRGSVAIVANLTEVGGRLILKETKTPSRRRSVALPRLLLTAMKERHRKVRPAPSDFVVTAPEGGGIRRTTFRHRVWLPLIKKAKVPTITLYGLRHSSASLMAAMGVPLLVASRAMGHSNIRTTANTYTHLFDETQREVASKFDAFLKDV
jgi:integrase